MTVTDPASSTEERPFPFLLTDADEHSTPRFGAHVEYMDPDKRHLAITWTRKEDGTMEALYAGRPARLRPKSYQVTFSDDQLAELGVKGAGTDSETTASDRDGAAVVPGSLLNKLNPLKGLDAEGRREFARTYRELQPLLDNPADRLTVMDAQGIEAAVNYATLANEYEFEDNWEALYANQRLWQGQS